MTFSREVVQEVGGVGSSVLTLGQHYRVVDIYIYIYIYIWRERERERERRKVKMENVYESFWRESRDEMGIFVFVDRTFFFVCIV